jgi:hypothetical protein
MTRGWKLLTHDFRPPIRGGDPLFDGVTFPIILPPVECDTSEKECSFGYNFVGNIDTGLNIAGFWRSGRPNAIIEVEAESPLERGAKLRAPSLTLLRHATADEIRSGIGRYSVSHFGSHAEAMAEEQWLWYEALARPLRNREAVIAGLEAALTACDLKWTLREYPTARAAWATRNAWAAWDAKNALTVSFAARSGWISPAHDKLTIGIRDAYLNGLAIAVPGGLNELGWAMES